MHRRSYEMLCSSKEKPNYTQAVCTTVQLFYWLLYSFRKLFDRIITWNHFERCKVQCLEGYLSKKIRRLRRLYSKVPALPTFAWAHPHTDTCSTWTRAHTSARWPLRGIKLPPTRSFTMLKPKSSTYVANISYLRSSCTCFFIHGFPYLHKYVKCKTLAV